jgi:hypothetical protein
MKTKFLVLSLALVSAPVFLFAQANFRKALIVKMNGDTTSGFIRYEGWTKSPTDVQFKKNIVDTQIETLTPNEIRSFSIDGIEKYVGYTGQVSTNKIEGDGIAYVRDSTIKMVSNFLRTVTSGSKVALLAHRDEIKTAYFIMENNGKPEELKFYRYYNDNDRLVTSAPFRTVVIALLEKYRGVNERWFKEVGTADYRLSSLQKLIKAINNDVTEDHSTSGYRFFVGAAGAYQRFTFDGPERYSYQRIDNNIEPIFNIGYDFYTNKFAPKTIFRAEASITRISPMFEGPYSIFVLKAVVVSVKPQVLYSFNAENSVKPFIGVAIGVNIPFETDNRLFANPKAIPSPGTQTILINGDTRGSLQVGQSIKRPYLNLATFVTPEVKAGISFNSKFEIIATGALFSSNMLKSLIPTQMTFYSLGLNYYWGGK